MAMERNGYRGGGGLLKKRAKNRTTGGRREDRCSHGVGW